MRNANHYNSLMANQVKYDVFTLRETMVTLRDFRAVCARLRIFGDPAEAVFEAFHRAMDGAARLNTIDDVTERIRQLVDASDSAATQFVRQAIQRRKRSNRTGDATAA